MIFFSFPHQLFLFISVKCFVKKIVKYFQDIFKLSLRMHIRLNLCCSFDYIILLPNSMFDISC